MKQRPSQQAFKRDESYEFGELTKDASIDLPRFRVKSVIRSGHHFLGHGCKTVQDYLDQNPDGLRTDRTITFYRRMPNGERYYMHAGNPAAPQESAGLADAPMVPPALAQSAPLPTEPQMSQDMAMKVISETVETQRQLNRDLMAQINELRADNGRLHEYYAGQIGELQTQLMRMNTELQEARRQYNELDKEYKIKEEFQKTVNTLQDKITESNQGFGLKDLTALLPHVMPFITAFMNRPGASTGAAPGPAPMPMPMPPAPMPNGGGPAPMPMPPAPMPIKPEATR